MAAVTTPYGQRHWPLRCRRYDPPRHRPNRLSPEGSRRPPPSIPGRTWRLIRHVSLEASVLQRHADHTLCILMPAGKVGSLNLANAVSIVLYEALRQVHGW
jgi:hypothetical protein